MPYLPVDLDAKRLAEGIERALCLPRFAVVGGLLELWEGVWRQKSDVVDGLTLWAAFGPDERLRDALVAREFIEPTGDGKYRVRGAAKWLFGMEGRSRGGKAARRNLIPGAIHRKRAEEPKPVSSAPAEGQPKASRRPPSAPPSALTPSTQHPAPKEELLLSAEPTAPEAGGASSDGGTPDERRVFEHWRAVMGKNGRTAFDDKRRKAVKARLKNGYSPEDLMRAVDGCAQTPHNAGQNDRGERFDDLELICRDAAHVDRFIRNAQSPPLVAATKGRASFRDTHWGEAPESSEPEILEAM